MNENQELFKKLLTIDELYKIYCQIGDVVLTNIDIENINADKVAKENSIQLLSDLLLIACEPETRIYYKKILITNRATFISKMMERLFDVYPDVFSFMDRIEIRYDEIEVKYYTKRNFIELNLSGLLMLLSGMEIIQFKDNYIYFTEKRLLLEQSSRRRLIGGRKKTDLDGLKNKLSIQEQLGDAAEIMAIEFERNILLQNNILKNPEQVSLYDVGAGYDIVSYMTSNSSIPDKFIEVKSCADKSLQFYISRNELEVAKNKRSNYFLYLFNRKTKKFTIIIDPYIVLLENKKNNWFIEPELYRIHYIGSNRLCKE